MAVLLLTTILSAGVLLIVFTLSVNCSELEYSDIKAVGQNNSYLTLNPNATFDLFEKIRHVKGNIIFKAGCRINGDRLLENHLDSEQFSKPEDVEVLLNYPAGGEGRTITFVEILADPDQNSKDADTGFIRGTGGIYNKTCQILVRCNKTSYFGYEVFIYGY